MKSLRRTGRVRQKDVLERLTPPPSVVAVCAASLLTILSLERSHADTKTLASALPTPQPVACLATQYAHPGDKWAGDKFYCTNTRVDHRKWGIAHRTLPCGTMVLITNIRNGKSVRAPVIDRGPYWIVPTKCSRDDYGFPSHACWNRGRAKVSRYLDPASGITFASCADLTPPVARAIGLNGKEPVIVYVLPKKKPKPKRYQRPRRTRRNW